MPAKSKAQFKLMAAAANSPAIAKKVGIKAAVAKEFIDKTKSYKALPKKAGKK